MAALFLVLAALIFGWLLGGPLLLTRRVMALRLMTRQPFK
jgi:hypothetical protein